MIGSAFVLINRFLAKVGTLSFRLRPCDWVDLKKKRSPPISCQFQKVSLPNCQNCQEIGGDFFLFFGDPPSHRGAI